MMKKINKIIIFVLVLLFVFLMATGCSDSSNFFDKFSLVAPTVSADGLALSWNKVGRAIRYEIFNAKDNSLIGKTTNLSYTCKDIIDDTDIYVKAVYDKESALLKNAGKSNIVRVSVPVLETPQIYASKNQVSWTAIRNASYYKVFNSLNDKLIAKTKETSIKLKDVDDQNLNVYVIAYYESYELLNKQSKKSNIVKVNPDILEVELDGISKNTDNYIIEEYVKQIIFTGVADHSIGITVAERSKDLSVVFDNVSLTSDGVCFYADNNNFDINITVIGNCSLSSKNSNAIKVSQLSLTGNSGASITVTGGDGKNGANGTSGYSGREDGARGSSGTDGKNGENGFDAIVADYLAVTDIQLVSVGGNGGNGGKGGNGGNGHEGKTLVNIITGGKDGNRNFGGNGGSGGNGGNGGNPGNGIISTCEIIPKGTAEIRNKKGLYGIGGDGGDGGDGGKGGNFYNSLGSVWRCSGGCGGDGGNGGNGRIAGSGGAGGSVGSRGSGQPVNGIGLGINYGSVFSDGNDSISGYRGLDGKVLS